MAIGYLPVLRIWDVYPGHLFFSIPDPIRREKSKLVVLPGTFFLEPYIFYNCKLPYFIFLTGTGKYLSKLIKK
jgi:hypothetical protein